MFVAITDGHNCSELGPIYRVNMNKKRSKNFTKEIRN